MWLGRRCHDCFPPSLLWGECDCAPRGGLRSEAWRHGCCSLSHSSLSAEGRGRLGRHDANVSRRFLLCVEAQWRQVPGRGRWPRSSRGEDPRQGQTRTHPGPLESSLSGRGEETEGRGGSFLSLLPWGPEHAVVWCVCVCVGEGVCQREEKCPQSIITMDLPGACYHRIGSNCESCDQRKREKDGREEKRTHTVCVSLSFSFSLSYLTTLYPSHFLSPSDRKRVV